MKKKIIAIILVIGTVNIFYSQTNIYPSSGNVGIGTILPEAPLHIEKNGILLKLSNNSNNFAYSGIDGLGLYLEQVADTPNKSQIRLQARNSNQGIYSQLFIDGANSRFNFINGNVGIGTLSPSNDQGWNRVLDVSGTNHSKILVSSENSLYKNGIFSHSSWHGGGGFVGTESNHSLFLMAGYDPKMTILTNGNIGVGTSTPATKLHISSAGNSGSLDYNMILQKTVVTDNDKSAVGLLFSTECCGPFGKSAIVHERTGGYGVGDLHFLNNNTIDNTNPTLVNSRMTISSNGNVGIGTPKPTSKLTVAGNINSREVKVSVDAGADFVFEKEYALPSLQEVEKFVTENKHLPEIASAKEMQKEGINLSEMNIKLLQKIEELTLYLIEQEKKNTIQSKEIEKLKEEKESYKIIFERLTEIEKKLR